MSARAKITGNQFMEAMEAAGVIPAGRPLVRVIIDAPYNEPVTVYCQERGTDALLDIELLAGLQLVSDEGSEAA